MTRKTYQQFREWMLRYGYQDDVLPQGASYGYITGWLMRIAWRAYRRGFKDAQD